MAAETAFRGKKRQRDEASESMSSSHSSPQYKYKLRQTTSPGCIFGGIKSCNTSSAGSASSTSSGTDGSSFSSPQYNLQQTTSPGCIFGGSKFFNASSTDSWSSSTSCHGPSTSTWEPAHYKRLNFNVINTYSLFGDAPLSDDEFDFKNVIQQPLMKFLFKPVGHCTKIAAPNIVDDVFLETIQKELSGNDLVILYVNNLCEDLESHGFAIKSASKEQNEQLQAYIHGLSIGEELLPPTIIEHIKNQICQIHEVCAENAVEIEIDEIIKQVLYLIIMKEENLNAEFSEYHVLLRDATRFYFDICGVQVKSETNVLLAYSMHFSINAILNGLPLVLSENKGSIHEKGKATKSTARHSHKSTPAVAHQKISQVIGQCLSVADKSPFETDDFKIVYHVSLMGTSHVVVTRTHVAKTTLRVIKDGCGVPNQQELDLSYTFTMSFEINNSPMLCFKMLYLSFSYLFKLSQKKIQDMS
ncbi:uncharacterized protein LOC144453720 [Glandiceps talaboti]